MTMVINGSGTITGLNAGGLPDASVTNADLSLSANASNVMIALNATGSAPIYACRAWVNFNGTGTVAIRASGNVSSITDNGTGDYTVNFTTAMPDANYAAQISGSRDNTTSRFGDNFINYGPSTTTTQRILTNNAAGTALDWVALNVSIFR